MGMTPAQLSWDSHEIHRDVAVLWHWGDQRGFGKQAGLGMSPARMVTVDLPCCWLGKRAQCLLYATGCMALCLVVREWCRWSMGTGGFLIPQKG